MTDLWRSVSILHQHRIAHRQLRTENILLDDDGHAWLIGLGHAELGSTDRQLDIDVAELMVSLAAKVGSDRAVSSAIAGLGAPAVEAAEGYVQPLAVVWRHSGEGAPLRPGPLDQARRAPRQNRRSGPVVVPTSCATLGRRSASATGTPPSKLETISRFTWKRALALLGGFVIIYILLPQLSNAGAAIRGAAKRKLVVGPGRFPDHLRGNRVRGTSPAGCYPVGIAIQAHICRRVRWLFSQQSHP